MAFRTTFEGKWQKAFEEFVREILEGRFRLLIGVIDRIETKHGSLLWNGEVRIGDACFMASDRRAEELVKEIIKLAGWREYYENRLGKEGRRRMLEKKLKELKEELKRAEKVKRETTAESKEDYIPEPDTGDEYDLYYYEVEKGFYFDEDRFL